MSVLLTSPSSGLTELRLCKGPRVVKDFAQHAIVVDSRSMNVVVTGLKSVGHEGSFGYGKLAEARPTKALHIDINIGIVNDIRAGAQVEFTLLDVLERFEVARGQCNSDLTCPGLTSGLSEHGRGIIIVSAQVASVISCRSEMKGEIRWVS